MPRKAIASGGKRDEIINAALKLFFEHGYDGTSIRMIQKEVGSEAGLFYYYFSSKDDLFDKVLDLFFLNYTQDFKAIVEHGKRNPCRVMSDFFEYMERETNIFREKYSKNMHRTVRWAIREHTLTIIEPFLKEIVDIQSNYYGVKPPLQPDVAALFLTHGTGSSILHEDFEKYQRLQPEFKKGISLIMGMPANEQELRIPQRATKNDINGCLDLAIMTKEYFYGFDNSEFESQLKKHIAKNGIWIIRHKGQVIAQLMYSKDRAEIDFLTVHPDYRRKGLGGRLLESAIADFEIGRTVSVTTFKEQDEQSQGARGLYHKFGFTDGEMVYVFGYLCQRMTLIVPEISPLYKCK